MADGRKAFAIFERQQVEEPEVGIGRDMEDGLLQIVMDINEVAAVAEGGKGVGVQTSTADTLVKDLFMVLFGHYLFFVTLMLHE